FFGMIMLLSGCRGPHSTTDSGSSRPAEDKFRGHYRISGRSLNNGASWANVGEVNTGALRGARTRAAGRSPPAERSPRRPASARRARAGARSAAATIALISRSNAGERRAQGSRLGERRRGRPRLGQRTSHVAPSDMDHARARRDVNVATHIATLAPVRRARVE